MPGIELGRVVGVFGVRGWIRLRSNTQPAEQILSYRQWNIAGREWRLVEGRAQGDSIVAHLEGLDDRDAALQLRGATIEVDRSALPQAAPGEFYWADLVGSRVVTERGAELGTLQGVTSNGVQDVMMVQGERERLIPFVHGAIVKGVEPGRIVVDWEPEY